MVPPPRSCPSRMPGIVVPDRSIRPDTRLDGQRPSSTRSSSAPDRSRGSPRLTADASYEVDTVGEVGSGDGEGGEAGGTGGGARGRPEPGREALEVDRGRGGDVLHVRPGQPAVAAAAQAEGTHTPGQGALDPGPPAVAAPALLGREPLPCRRLGLVLRPRVQPQAAGLAPGARAQGPRRAGAAVGLGEADQDVALAPVDVRLPGRGQLPLRAARPPPVPESTSNRSAP